MSITTAEELAALPEGSMVRDHMDSLHVAYQQYGGECVWHEVGYDDRRYPLSMVREIGGTFTVLYRPDAAHDEQVRAERTLPDRAEVARVLWNLPVNVITYDRLITLAHWQHGSDYRESLEHVRRQARAVLALMADAPTVEQVREQIAQEVEAFPPNRGRTWPEDDLLTALARVIRDGDPSCPEHGVREDERKRTDCADDFEWAAMIAETGGRP